MIRQFYDGYGEHFKLSDGTDFKYPSQKCPPEKKEEIICKESGMKKQNPINDILSGIKADDIVLLGVLIFLLSDGTDDYILLIILGIIFIMGLTEKEC